MAQLTEAQARWVLLLNTIANGSSSEITISQDVFESISHVFVIRKGKLSYMGKRVVISENTEGEIIGS